MGAEPYSWGTRADVRAIVTQTGDPRWRAMDPSWFSELLIVVDGRNSLTSLALPGSVRYRGIGVQAHR